MKKIICFLVLVFFLSSTVVATSNDDVNVYVYPSDLLYSLKLGFENMRLFILPSKIWKAEYCLKLADKRSKELQRMVNENKLKYINQLESERSKFVNKAYSYGGELSDLSNQKYIFKKIEEKTEKHLIVLESIRSKTYQKKERVNTAIIDIKKVKKKVLEKIAGVDKKLKYTAEVIGNG